MPPAALKLQWVFSVHMSIVSKLPGSVLVAGLLPACLQRWKEIAREQNYAFLGKPLPLEWRDMACHFYFVSPSKVSNNIARIRASKKRILFKRRHLSSLVYFRKRSLLLHILRSVIKIAISLRKGLMDRGKWQRQRREIVLHLSEQASTLITLLSTVGAIKSETICIPGVAGYLHGNKSPWHYCRSSLTSYCCLFAVTC